MSLTPAGCARLWQSVQARRPEPWEGRRACIGCSIGAANAGQPAEKTARDACAEALRDLCPRCGRIAFRGDRQQVLVQGKLCVSCWNRDREAERGKNAKGNPPKLCGHLHTIRLASGGRVLTFSRVVSRTEAAILAAKASGGPVVIGLAPLFHGEARQ